MLDVAEKGTGGDGIKGKEEYRERRTNVYVDFVYERSERV